MITNGKLSWNSAVLLVFATSRIIVSPCAPVCQVCFGFSIKSPHCQPCGSVPIFYLVSPALLSDICIKTQELTYKPSCWFQLQAAIQRLCSYCTVTISRYMVRWNDTSAADQPGSHGAKITPKYTFKHGGFGCTNTVRGCTACTHLPGSARDRWHIRGKFQSYLKPEWQCQRKYTKDEWGNTNGSMYVGVEVRQKGSGGLCMAEGSVPFILVQTTTWKTLFWLCHCLLWMQPVNGSGLL